MTLAAELKNDPLNRGYAAMTDQQIVDSLNAVDRTLPRDAVPTSEVFEAIVPEEYAALTAAQKASVNLILSLDSVRVNGANTRGALLDAFGPGKTTRANLAALQTRPVSRAEEIGIARPRLGEVMKARAT